MRKLDKRARALENDREYRQQLFQLRLRVVDGVLTIVAMVGCTGPPSWCVWKVVEVLAGKTTVVSVSAAISISVAVTVASSGAAVLAWLKMKRQTRELIYCRQRMKELEAAMSNKRKMEKEQ